MADYPWSVLDLDPTSDVRLIRKAYAGKLRVTRPDEDPDGFQRLVEARDFALRLAPQIELLPSFPIEDEPDPAAMAGDDVPEQEIPLSSFFSPEQMARLVMPSTLRPVVETAPILENVVAEAQTPGADEQDHGDIQAGDQNYRVAPVIATERAVPAADRLPERALPPPVTPGEIAKLLQGLDQPNFTASTRSRWSSIFDRAEQAPLESHDLIMALIVRRLVLELHQRAFSVYDDGLFPKKQQASDRPAVIEMGHVLIDFERHFRLLDEDKILRRYLPDDDALFLIDAMTLACGREVQRSAFVKAAPPVSRLHATPIIDLDFLEAAYRQDRAILDYYNKCRLTGRYASSFSGFALLFPLAWAMCYRLVGLAWLFGVLMMMMVGISVIHHFGRATEIDDLVPAVYVSISLACAFQSNRLRLQELARAVISIQGKGGTHQLHIDKVHRAMHRSRIQAVVGFLITGVCIYLAIQFGIMMDTVAL